MGMFLIVTGNKEANKNSNRQNFATAFHYKISFGYVHKVLNVLKVTQNSKYFEARHEAIGETGQE